MEQKFCQKCNSPIFENYVFCPQCGIRIKEQPLTIFRQIGIYTLSLLLPPLGLWPAFKLLRQKNEKAKAVAIMAIILTGFSIAITLWISLSFYTRLASQINQINQITGQINQLNQSGQLDLKQLEQIKQLNNQMNLESLGL